MNGKNSKKQLTVGFTYNTIPSQHFFEENDGSFLAKFGEWDDPETINGVITSLESAGHKVIPIEAVVTKNYDAYDELKKHGKELDIVFNIAEGLATPNRESLIPAMLEWLNIPYTGSDAKALAIGLDKVTTLEILSQYHINVGPHFVFKTQDDVRDLKRYAHQLEKIFPLVVKPVSEGTSVGMSQKSVVEGIEDLRQTLEHLIDEYKQPAMV